MTDQKVFLQAEWRKLAMANYAVEPEALKNYIPFGTELDTWRDTCYMSLVGFMFLNTKVKGIRIPFHTDFEEVNLRFYVKYKSHNEWRRGVVFIREIVPKPMLSWVANTIYKEHYVTLPMQHTWERDGDRLHIEYKWKKQLWHSISIHASDKSVVIPEGSEEEFITEHYWGYTRLSDARTSEYAVEHPRWEVYPVMDHTIQVDFGMTYGKDFEFLNSLKPVSVYLAEGSEIVVKAQQILIR